MKNALLFVSLLLISLPMMGQTDADCPGWKNTTSFNTGDSNFHWSARVGERIMYSHVYDTTTGYYIMSTCAAPNAQVITGHANITSAALNSGEDDGIQCCGDGGLWDANGRRFQIITAENAGLDQFTINGGTGMQRICPGYTTSIRLGDPRATGNCTDYHVWASGSNKGSEALFYSMRVTPMNSLLIINYAVVGRCFSHGPHQAGEFLVRIVKQNDDGTWQDAPINDSLWFKVSAPAIPTSGPIPPWTMGRPGESCTFMSDAGYTNTTCAYVYKPWTKVAMSLSKFMGQNIRVEMYTSDCVYDVDPIYAYVAGDFQPMRIDKSGCANALSEAIDTLVAPAGLSRYTWYVTTSGAEEDILNEDYMETVHFRQLTQPSNNNIYVPTIEDFIITEGPHAGDTINNQTFMCTMVSALDPNKPFISKVYANLENTKPTAVLSLTTDCDLIIHLSDQSRTYSTDQIDPDSTRWVIYADSIGLRVLDTLWGTNVDYQLPNDGYYRVSMRTMIQGKPCSSVKERVFRVQQPHELPITMEEVELCEDETAVAWVVGGENLDKEWSIDGNVVFRSDATHPYDTIIFNPTIGNHVITLTTSTGGLCTGTSSLSFRVFGYSTLSSSLGDSIICRGESITLVSTGIDQPYWYSSPYDYSLTGSDGHSVVTVTPQVTTYYSVRPMEENRCQQNNSDITITVIPYPTLTIYKDKSILNYIDPAIYIEDRSTHSTSSHWTFSDGFTADGTSVNHHFETTPDSVWFALYTCNENLCCVDTTVYLAVENNTMWIPNIITPNLVSNKRFSIYSMMNFTYFELWIYNRQGLLVFHSDDVREAWDGNNLNGTPCPQGVYVYRYIYSNSTVPDERHTGEGSITLLR